MCRVRVLISTLTSPFQTSKGVATPNCQPCRKQIFKLGDCPSLGPDGKAERDEVAKFHFRARVGEHLWITRVSSPDISHAVNDLARVAHNPGLSHVRALQHVSRYLATTPRMGLLYEKPATLAESYPVGWTDANYAPNYNAGDDSPKDNYRSTSAYIFTCNGTAVTWRSRRQQVLATSSCDSETYAAAAAAKEAVHLRTPSAGYAGGNITTCGAAW